MVPIFRIPTNLTLQAADWLRRIPNPPSGRDAAANGKRFHIKVVLESCSARLQTPLEYSYIRHARMESPHVVHAGFLGYPRGTIIHAAGMYVHTYVQYA